MSVNKVLLSVLFVIAGQHPTNASVDEDEEYLLHYNAKYVMKNLDGTDVVPTYHENFVSNLITDREPLVDFVSEGMSRSYSAPDIFIFIEHTKNEIPLIAVKKPAMFLCSDFILNNVVLHSHSELELPVVTTSRCDENQ